MITVSAPGKLLLFGEHAVVYGYPSLVTAVSQRLSVELESNDVGRVVIDAPQVADTRFVDAAIEKTYNALSLAREGLTIRTKSSFSGVYGFGSSSAVTVAVVKALSVFYHKELTPKQIFDISYSTVLDVQKVGSGFDVAAASFGGTMWYVKGGVALEHLSWNSSPCELIVGYSGVKSNTVDVVNSVAKKRETHGQHVERIFQAITKLTEEAKQKIIEEDWERVGKLMTFNQEYLRDLGVSCQKLEDLIHAALSAGAYGAKLSGAGAGDCMIAMAPRDKSDAIKQAIVEAGGEVVHVTPHEEGVRVETTDNQSEQFIVVDENDSVIGYRSRYDCHHDPSLIHRAAGVVIKDEKGRVLLQKRSMSKDLGAGLWGTSAAGHVTKGESYEACAHRELLEELGVDIPIAFVNTYMVRDEKETEYNAVFSAIYNGPFHPDPSEIDRIEFFDKNEFPRKLLSGEIQLTKCAEASLRAVRFI